MKDGKTGDKIRKLQELACLLERRIGEAEKLCRYDGESSLPYRYREENILAAAELSEKLTGKLRELAAGCVMDPKRLLDYRERLPEIHQICVRYQNGILEIRLPVLLPHRKGAYTEFLDKPLACALQKWSSLRREKGEQVPAFQQAAICFVHGYLDATTVRDHDNIEAKHVQDVLALFFLQGDDGMHLDLYHTSELAGKNQTVLYLMEREKFPEWVLKRRW